MISVVLPARNAASTIGRQLRALEAQEFEGDWEVVVADNGSTDATRAVVEAYEDRLPELRMVDASGRRGSAFARACGVDAAKGSVLAFCDADDEVRPGWLSALAHALEDAEVAVGHTDAALGSGTLVPIESAEPPRWDTPYLGFLPVFDSCNLAMRREVFDRFGGFDPRYRYSSDVELSWRMQLGGVHAVYVPDAIVRKAVRTGWRARLVQQWHWARYHPRLYRQYRSAGVRPSPPVRALGAYALLIADIPRLHSADVRGEWLARLATRGGRLVGSIAEGVLFL